MAENKVSDTVNDMVNSMVEDINSAQNGSILPCTDYTSYSVRPFFDCFLFGERNSEAVPQMDPRIFA